MECWWVDWERLCYQGLLLRVDSSKHRLLPCPFWQLANLLYSWWLNLRNRKPCHLVCEQITVKSRFFHNFRTKHAHQHYQSWLIDIHASRVARCADLEVWDLDGAGQLRLCIIGLTDLERLLLSGWLHSTRGRHVSINTNGDRSFWWYTWCGDKATSIQRWHYVRV